MRKFSFGVLFATAFLGACSTTTVTTTDSETDEWGQTYVRETQTTETKFDWETIEDMALVAGAAALIIFVGDLSE